MPSEEERDEAREQIGVALEKWVEAMPPADQEAIDKGIGILGDWIAVVCMVDVDEEGHPVATYYVAMRGGSMLPHVAQGLLGRGMEELEAREHNGNEE